MTVNNILIYPKFKKSKTTSIESDNDIEAIANHYTVQFFKAMENHGVLPDAAYLKDLMFFKHVIKAIVCRTQGKYHSIQDWMDDSYVEEIHKGGPLSEDDFIEEDE